MTGALSYMYLAFHFCKKEILNLTTVASLFSLLCIRKLSECTFLLTVYKKVI